MSDLFVDFQKTIQNDGFLERGSRLVVGVSGGVDSMVLLDLLLRLREEKGWTIFACHIQHGMREEAHLDLELVERYCEENEVLLRTFQIDMARLAEEWKTSLEDAGRRARRRFYVQVAEEVSASVILLGHHKEDQAETILMRMMRGSGLAGLSGMHRKAPIDNLSIYRPLLEMSKEDLYAYATTRGVPFLEDGSNRTNEYLRNKMRNELIPWMEREVNPNIVQTMTRMGNQFAIDEDYLQREAHLLYRGAWIRFEAQRYSVDRAWFLGLHLAMQVRVLRLLILDLRGSVVDVTEEDLHRIISVFSMETGKNVLVCDMIFTCFYDAVVCHMGVLHDEPFPEIAVSLESVDRATTLVEVANATLTFSIVDSDRQTSHGMDSQVVFFDRDEISSISIRPPKEKDRIRAFGASGSKELRRAFTDWKVEKGRRAAWPLVVNQDDEILWAVGLRRSALAPIDEKTVRVLKIVWGKI